MEHAMMPTSRLAFLTMGSGDYLGSTVRDLALANALHRRGHKVVIYWMMEINEELADAGIEQHMLCHGTRYHFATPSELLDRVVGRLLFLLPKRWRVRVVQGRGGYVDRLLGNLVAALAGRPEGDARLARRLRDRLARDGVGQLLVSFASLGPLALASKKLGGHDFDYLLTFQGDEQFAAHARRLGLFEPFRRALNDAVQASAWPAVVVSADYAGRISEELGVPDGALKVVYNGVEQGARSAGHSFSLLKTVFPGLSPHYPIVGYVGRQDVEKGIDLLLYAAALLARRGVTLQLVVCGATAKGTAYRKVLADLAEHLGVHLFHAGSVTNQVRDSLYAHSHCVVYPSVNREPFGLVVAEAMSHGTPVLVPDYGGIGEVIRNGEQAGGLTFPVWDSGGLAAQLERLLLDRSLQRQLAGDARLVAARFSVDRMTDDVLHLLAEGRQAAGRHAVREDGARVGSEA
jgi:glycosyltransferase involved in cell wall biosynthesis